MSKLSIGIVGIREFGDQEVFNKRLEKKLNEVGKDNIKEILTGDGKGVSALVRDYCKEHGIRCKVLKADWDSEPKMAGAIRDNVVVQRTKMTIVFWDESCPFVKQAFDRALKLRRQVKVISIQAGGTYYCQGDRPTTEREVKA